MEPTKEQIQWLWEQCGFRQETRDCIGMVMYETPQTIWIHPDGKEAWQPPPIDLNNLFKYAVPKLEECHLITFRQNEYYSIAKLNGKVVDATDKNPADSLFQAIYKAFGGDNV